MRISAAIATYGYSARGAGNDKLTDGYIVLTFMILGPRGIESGTASLTVLRLERPFSALTRRYSGGRRTRKIAPFETLAVETAGFGLLGILFSRAGRGFKQFKERRAAVGALHPKAAD